MRVLMLGGLQPPGSGEAGAQMQAARHLMALGFKQARLHTDDRSLAKRLGIGWQPRDRPCQSRADCFAKALRHARLAACDLPKLPPGRLTPEQWLHLENLDAAGTPEVQLEEVAERAGKIAGERNRGKISVQLEVLMQGKRNAPQLTVQLEGQTIMQFPARLATSGKAAKRLEKQLEKRGIEAERKSVDALLRRLRVAEGHGTCQVQLIARSRAQDGLQG